MKDSYVSNNIEQLLAANESQRNKIQFLQRERIKRDHYLSDLQQSLTMNKETLRQYNLLGSNQKSIDKLVKQTTVLISKLQSYYQEYQTINASLLMQQQMRLEDKQYYHERMAQFENKIVDLRKYLHDKEDNFTSVVTRLRKYEDLSEPTIDEKLHMFKKEIGEKCVNEYMADLIKQKNYYKCEWEKMRKDFTIFNEMKSIIVEKYKDVKSILQQYEEKGFNTNNLVLTVKKPQNDKDKKPNKKIEPNVQLIRLLKKQKLNNQLLEEALADAIEKNEQLIVIKDTLQSNLLKLQNKQRLLYSQNTILALRLAEYDQHYCRKHINHRQYYEQGEIKGLTHMTQKRVREYVNNVNRYYHQTKKLNSQYITKLKEDVNKWSMFICDSWQIKKALIKQNLLTKSSSTPSLITEYELEEQQQKLIIDEY